MVGKNQVVVLGGSGDVGSVLVSKLVDQRIKFTSPTSKQVDLRNALQTRNFFSTISGAYSLVFGAFLDRRQGDSEETLRANLMMVDNVVGSAKPNSMIFLSSMDVYGQRPDLPITENTMTSKASFYSQAKLSAESKLSETFGNQIPLTVLRLPGVYGGQGSRNSTLDRILASGMEKGIIDLGPGGTLQRDWISADEVARFLVHLLETPVVGIYNFATGDSWMINRYVSECLSELEGVRHQIAVVDDESVLPGVHHHFDVRHFTKTFPDWRFESRLQRLRIFAKGTYKHWKLVGASFPK